ncbi:MAG: TetR/AcrR family transcriptional regulator [Burkholderiaceae bacterium]|jgi:AcrR family transcriptional regulator|nr:TetR/AcrR family transcriptional regulator [Burkholderiaceae bacterium]MDH5208900.1 TetR/AcrR family transcriptional regulator [Burkholderiaceae bacterium]
MQRGDDARLALIDAAMREASRIGLAALTLAPVAERAGWSKSGLLRHFPSKESLQLAVVHRTTELFRERVLLPALSSPAGAPRLRAIFRNWLSWIADNGLDGGCPLNAARLEFDDQPGEVREALVAGWNDWLSYLERQAAKGIEDRQIRTTLSPRQVVMVAIGLASACDSMLRLLGVRQAVREAERAYDQLFTSE